ncbi:hypothetical protein [Serratia oryzae]|uniref:Uncharacterized protein n=1 Tax=Serratia oryzae TaxID=2034155 RepID=A0A1S8CI98_9GAMM|nr:hypothetical protein [Serratia oryzae]OMQ22172.1 hypothetical protein BMI79_11665 [Serratia oryzae]VXD08638.1 conserved hypothetical protein [Enterobacterales bacterium 8AC]
MSKAEAIKKVFGTFIGATLIGYSTAEIFVDRWEPWNDLPIRLAFNNGQIISVAWSKFDDLWLSNDQSLPFDIYDSKVRWIENAFDDLNRLIGGVILSVSLGQDYLELGGEETPLDIHLIIETDRGVMDIFNALDENGYAYLPSRPLNLALCVPFNPLTEQDTV